MKKLIFTAILVVLITLSAYGQGPQRPFQKGDLYLTLWTGADMEELSEMNIEGGMTILKRGIRIEYGISPVLGLAFSAGFGDREKDWGIFNNYEFKTAKYSLDLNYHFTLFRNPRFDTFLGAGLTLYNERVIRWGLMLQDGQTIDGNTTFYENDVYGKESQQFNELLIGLKVGLKYWLWEKLAVGFAYKSEFSILPAVDVSTIGEFSLGITLKL